MLRTKSVSATGRKTTACTPDRTASSGLLPAAIIATMGGGDGSAARIASMNTHPSINGIVQSRTTRDGCSSSTAISPSRLSQQRTTSYPAFLSSARIAALSRASPSITRIRAGRGWVIVSPPVDQRLPPASARRVTPVSSSEPAPMRQRDRWVCPSYCGATRSAMTRSGLVNSLSHGILPGEPGDCRALPRGVCLPRIKDDMLAPDCEDDTTTDAVPHDPCRGSSRRPPHDTRVGRACSCERARTATL